MTSQTSSTVLYIRGDGHFTIGADALASVGFNIVFTDAQAVAERVAQTCASSFALILIDFSAPAPALIRAMVDLRKPNSAWIPVIACCADSAEIEAAIAAGADDFLVASAASDAATVRFRVSVLLRQKARNDKLDGILSCTFDGIVTIDETGAIVTFNSAAQDMFDYEPAEVIGRNVSVLMPAPEAGQHDAHLRRYLATGKENIIGKGRQLVGRRKGGGTFPLFLQVTNVRSGRETVFVGILKDLSLEAHAHSLRHEVMHDTLTGIANRRQIQTVLESWIARRQDDRPQPFAVVFVDMDRFKAVNDTRGHEAGDAVLKAVGRRLSHAVSQGDVVGRLAGDEFVVLLDDVGSHAEARPIAQRLLASLAQPVRYGVEEISVSASAGVAVFPADAATPDGLLRRADTGMYRAKNTRRGTVSMDVPTL